MASSLMRFADYLRLPRRRRSSNIGRLGELHDEALYDAAGGSGPGVASFESKVGLEELAEELAGALEANLAELLFCVG